MTTVISVMVEFEVIGDDVAQAEQELSDLLADTLDQYPDKIVDFYLVKGDSKMIDELDYDPREDDLSDWDAWAITNF